MVKVKKRDLKWVLEFLQTQGWGPGFKRTLKGLKRAWKAQL